MANVITTILEKLKITKPSRNEKAGYFLMHDEETNEVSAIPVNSVLAKLNDRIDGVIYPDGFTKTTAINRVGNTVSIAPYDFAWRIQLNPYTNADAFSKTLDPTSSGELKRIDALAATTDGTIVYYKGDEDELIIKPPKVPTNELRLTDLTIFGDDVQSHTEPFISEVYVKKLESQDFIINYGATLVIEQINLTDDRNSISLTGAVTDVKSIKVSGEFIRMGKPHFVKNRTGHDVKLWHLEGTGNVKYFFPNGLDLIVKPNEVIQFNTNANDSAYVRFEYVGGATAVTGAMTYKGSVANYAALPSTGLNVGDVYNLTDTGHNYAWSGTTWDDLGPAVDVSGKEDVSNKTQDIETNKTSTSKYSSVKQLYDWAVAKFVRIDNIRTVNGNSLIGTTNLVTPDMDTTTAQDVTGVKTFRDGKLGLRNVANTFSITFTNAITVARSVTWPDKNGTVAYTSDIVDKLNGTVNYLVKFGTATTGIISRLFDNGTFFGIGTYNTPTKDITLGYQANREIGIEESDNITVGRDLIVSAGRTVNYVFSVNFIALNQTIRGWSGTAVDINGDVYACVNGGDIYKRTVGSSVFTGMSQLSIGWCAMAAAPNGDIYAVQSTFNIHRKPAASSSFSIVATGVGSPSWTSITVAPNGDVYACNLNGDIYKQTGGSGSYVALSQTSRAWNGMAAAPNGDIYACTNGGDIYKRTGGAGNFIALGQTSRAWSSMAASPNGNIYCCVNGGDIYMQTNGTGNFIALGQTSRAWSGISVAPNNNAFATVMSLDVFFQQNNGVGTNNLNGGKLKLKSGTGKGNAQSRMEFITGQKTASGTDMQIETVRAYFDEDGNYKRIGTPVYADNTAALSGGLTVGMEYRTSAGIKMEVY